ncbi:MULTISPECIES: hypothetical protein [Sphingomonas]|uniref:hypothetical protein n=1 Tax=Sphingomonas TaxID=13687 RepID=UPI00254C0CFA|nr:MULTISPECIES: hypothetical protein [Sphingomonas]MDK8186954.1 hypothetical protein [Sphingomonas zeae]MDK8216838.1 hypothetical protein [Sphingomonas sp. UMB7805-LC452B]
MCKQHSKAAVDIEGLRQRIRVMPFDRGSPEQVSLWRIDIAEARANLAIEGMTPTSDDDELFALMLDEAVPPSVMPSIILALYENVEALRQLPPRTAE